ncbi:MAG: hypothetical protein ACJ77K_17480 [Bacteroidia bacterium]
MPVHLFLPPGQAQWPVLFLDQYKEPIKMMTPIENLHMAIGELAYAIARADGAIQKEEQEEFHKLMKEGIRSGDGDLDISDIIFQVMEKDKFTNTETAYDWAMHEIRMNSHYLSPELKKMFVDVIQKVAEAYAPVTTEEKKLIERFKRDIAPLNGDPIYYEQYQLH